jgi:sialidase-1
MASEDNFKNKSMKRLILLSIATLMLIVSCNQQSPVKVFISGTGGYKSYRIPAIITLPERSLLAFAEGRVRGSADFGDVDIVLRRSTDNGKTWGQILTVADYDSLQAGNPAPVVDLTDPDYPGGRIFLFYNTGNNNEGEVRRGNGFREICYKTSSDGGKTWSEEVNITGQVHKPLMPDINPTYNFTEDWRSYANTPGHALQFTEGKYKGRLVVPANHSAGEPRENWEDYASHVYFSDDHGKSFRLGQTLNLPGSNEATAAEISGNRLLLNARNQKGDIRARIVAISNDGGETWNNVFFDNMLPDPVCQGSILNIGKYNGKSILAFSNPADTLNRDNLTLRISYNDGESWTKEMVIDKSSDSNKKSNYTAYSDLVSLASGRIGILYERDNYSEIVFKIVKPKSKY